MRVATRARILPGTIGTLVEVANRPTLATYLFTVHTFFVQEVPEFFQAIARDRGFIGGNGVITMMAVFPRGATDAVCQVNEFMGHGYFQRLGLHIWLYKNEVSMARGLW